MKHALPRTPRALSCAALIAALGGLTSAQAVGIHVGPGAPSTTGPAYSRHLGATKTPWKGKLVQAGPWSGYGKFAPTCPPPAPARVWVAGCWRIERERVWVAGPPQKVWVDAVYSKQCNGYGATVNVLVTPGHYAMVPGPGYWVAQPKKVWIPGHWVLAS